MLNLGMPKTARECSKCALQIAADNSVVHGAVGGACPAGNHEFKRVGSTELCLRVTG